MPQKEVKKNRSVRFGASDFQIVQAAAKALGEFALGYVARVAVERAKRDLAKAAKKGGAA